MPEEKWKRFEDATHEVIQGFYPEKKVYKGVYIEGKLSRVKRQVDIQVVEPEKYDFMAFECKDHKRPLDVSVVEAFNTTLMDIGAKRGAIVSNSDFTQAAINMAEALSIDLLHLVDTNNKDVRSEILANILIIDTQVKSWRFELSGTTPIRIPLDVDPRELRFINSEGDQVTAHNVLAHLWNEQNTPLNVTPGLHKYVPELQNYNLIGDNGELMSVGKLSFTYEVVEKYYAGKVPVERTQGLYNVFEKSLQTKEVLFERLSPGEFEEKNPEISKEDADKIVFALGLHVRSIYPEEVLGI